MKQRFVKKNKFCKGKKKICNEKKSCYKRSFEKKNFPPMIEENNSYHRIGHSETFPKTPNLYMFGKKFFET